MTSEVSKPTELTGPSEGDRFGIVNPTWWTRWSWVHVAFMLAWVVIWITAGPYDRIPGILVGLGALAFFFWVLRKGRESEQPEKNVVELGQDRLRIEAYGRTTLDVTYGGILGVGSAAGVSWLQRRLWMISKKDLVSCVEIELSEARWFVVWTFPWRWKRLFLKLLQPTQFELALKARLSRFAARRVEPASQ